MTPIRTLCLLVFVMSLALLPASRLLADPPPPPTGDITSPAYLTKTYPLKYTTFKTVKTRFDAELKPRWPGDLLAISALPDPHAVQVKAKHELAITHFEQWLGMLDTSPFTATTRPILVRNNSPLLIDPMDPATPLGMLKSLWPRGIELVVGLPVLNVLMVKAADGKSIDQFARLVEMLDRPPRRIVVEATLLTSTLTDISAAGMSLQARGAPLSV
ncbi:MAG: hypothetical protein ACYC7E_13675, partial [Armatimonadota bacterium]